MFKKLSILCLEMETWWLKGQFQKSFDKLITVFVFIRFFPYHHNLSAWEQHSLVTPRQPSYVSTIICGGPGSPVVPAQFYRLIFQSVILDPQ